MLRLALYFAALAVLYQVIRAAACVIRGEAAITERLLETWVLALCVVVGVFFTWDTYQYLAYHIPDGSYDIKVEAHSSGWKYDRSLPAVLWVSTDEDSVPYRDTERQRTERRYTLSGVYYGNSRTADNWRLLDVEIQAHGSVKVEIDDRLCTLTLGDVSADALGVTPSDNWRSMSVLTKLLDIAIPLACVLGLVQGIWIDKTGKERVKEWAERH